MSKPEWGIKRTCQSCGTRFYDLKRTPIVCPKCGHVHDVEDFVKTRRSRAQAPAKAAAAAAAKKGLESDLPVDDLETVDADETEADELIEDTDDLAEDDDIPDIADDEEGDSDR